MRAGEIVFTGMDRVVFGRPAAEAVVEAADRLAAKRVFILAGATLNRKTDAGPADRRGARLMLRRHA